MMNRFDIGSDGISELIAQAYSMSVLSNWFESVEQRTFVVKLTDYYLYMINHGIYNTDIEYEVNKKAYSVLVDLLKEKSALKESEIDDIVTKSFCQLMDIVGNVLVKEGVLLNKGDVDYQPFNIEIAIPKILLDKLGYCFHSSINDISDKVSFAQLEKLDDFQYLAESKYVVNAVYSRKEYSYKDLLETEFTEYETIVKIGMSYIIMGKEMIKGKVVCGLWAEST